ncbi:MAG: fold metallo-hydrolase [Thermomicrobiales bacterium]|nr:fold metallo-hydrolase [Thermomicrobiales bacterium]
MASQDQSRNASFIDTRQVGGAIVTTVSEGGLLWPPRFPVSESEWRQAMPEADADGRVWLGLNVIIIHLGEALIVVDPGMDDPDSAWQRERPRVWPDWTVTRTPGLAAALAELAIAPEDVTHVVITHPHGDHYPGVVVDCAGELTPRFPRARHFLGRADWEGNPRRVTPGSDLDRLELIDCLGLLELVNDEQEIVPGVTIVPAPGESPGHCVVRLESVGEVFYVLGDIVHHACEVEHPHWGPPHADPDTLAAARERIFPTIARERALLATAHEPFPPWGRIVDGGNGYRWQRY